jgi:hypothetical protein
LVDCSNLKKRFLFKVLFITKSTIYLFVLGKVKLNQK